MEFVALETLDHAKALTDCVYAVYGLTFHRDWVYDPAQLLELNRRRHIRSFLALEGSTVQGHIAWINPAHATEIFIREALVGDAVAWPFGFLTHNRKVRDQAETRLTRTRSSGYMNLDEALYRFYAARLAEVSAVPELVDIVRHAQAKDPKFLYLREEDLRPAEEVAHDAEAFPEALPIDNRVLPLTYSYQPGKH